eukprot:12421017-Karenia_brevis.AAC.1
MAATADWNPNQYTFDQHNLASPAVREHLGKIVSFNSAVIQVRSLCKRRAFSGRVDTAQHIRDLFQKAWIRG